MNKFLKTKIHFYYFICMVALLLVHNYNYVPNVVSPPSIIKTHFTISHFIEMLLSNSLLRFRLPLLMTISGYLMANAKILPYKTLFIKKVKTLLIPYILISTIALFITLIFQWVAWGVYTKSHPELLGKNIWNFTFKDFFYYLTESPLAFQMWYLKIIFIFSLLSPVFRYILTKIPHLFLGTLIIVWLFTNYLDGDVRDRTFIFYGIGFYLRLYHIDIRNPLPKFQPNIAIGVFIFLSLLRTCLAFSAFETTLVQKFILTFLFKCIEVIGAYAVWFGFDKQVRMVVKTNWFKKYGNASFFIYAFHAPLINYINDVLHTNQLFSRLGIHLLAYVCLPILLLVFLIMGDGIFKKYLPNFYHLLTGGRGNAPNTRGGVVAS